MSCTLLYRIRFTLLPCNQRSIQVTISSTSQRGRAFSLNSSSVRPALRLDHLGSYGRAWGLSVHHARLRKQALLSLRTAALWAARSRIQAVSVPERRVIGAARALLRADSIIKEIGKCLNKMQ